MGYGINTHSMTSVDSFKRAQKIFAEQLKPRGTTWADHERPLDSNRQHHKRINRWADEEAYSCILYQTALVTYRKNGSVDVRLHDSMSSRAFLDRTLPNGMRAVSHNGKTCLKVWTADTELFLFEGSMPLRFEPDGTYKWKLVSDAMQRKRTVFDRSRAAEIRRKLKPFVVWKKSVDKLIGESNVVNYGRGWNLGGIAASLYNDIENTERWGEIRECCTVEDLLDTAYWHLGARTRQDIPNSMPLLQRPLHSGDS